MKSDARFSSAEKPLDVMVTDPWQELQSERNRHKQTIDLMRRLVDLLGVWSAAGTISTEVCKLCQGERMVQDRAHCPHRWLPAYAATQTDRLKKKVRRPTATPEPCDAAPLAPPTP